MARHRGRSSFCAVSLTQLKSGLALSPGDRFWRGSLHASSLFSYEAVQNGEKNSRTRQKVLTQYIVGPSTPLDGCRGVWWPWLGGARASGCCAMMGRKGLTGPQLVLSDFWRDYNRPWPRCLRGLHAEWIHQHGAHREPSWASAASRLRGRGCVSMAQRSWAPHLDHRQGSGRWKHLVSANR